MSGNESDESAHISNESSSVESETESEVDADCGVVNFGNTAIIAPYQDEPILSESMQEEETEETDIDGISLDILQARFEKQTPLNEW